MQIIQTPSPTYRQSSKDAGTLQELSDKKTVELLMSYVKPDAKNFRSYFFRTSRNVTPLKAQIKKYDHKFSGRNSRLDTIQSAVLNIKLKNYKKVILLH